VKLHALPELPDSFVCYVLAAEKSGTTCPPSVYKLVILLRSLISAENTVFHNTVYYNARDVETFLYLHGEPSEDRWDEPADLREIVSVTSSKDAENTMSLICGKTVFSGNRRGIAAWHGLQTLLLQAVFASMAGHSLEFVKTQSLPYRVDCYDIVHQGGQWSRTLARVQVQDHFTIKSFELV
jgi:hypothetical protein